MSVRMTLRGINFCNYPSVTNPRDRRDLLREGYALATSQAAGYALVELGADLLVMTLPRTCMINFGVAECEAQ
jgi:hypothetical protein